MNIDKTAPSGASTTSTRLAQEQTPAPATLAGSSPATGSPDPSGMAMHDAQASMRSAAALSCPVLSCPAAHRVNPSIPRKDFHVQRR